MPASFFVIEEAAKSPDSEACVRRRPLIATTPTPIRHWILFRRQLRWQLNITQHDRKYAWREVILFRPPFGIDHLPEYAEEVAQLPVAQDMGYLIVGQKVDPHDWRQPYGKQVPAEEIIDAMRQADLEN